MRRLIVVILLYFLSLTQASSQDPATSGKILIINSYTSDTQTSLTFITSFSDYIIKNSNYEIVIEDMNAKSLALSAEWESRMRSILAKYSILEERPRLIVLLGQEAWATYLSMPLTVIPEKMPVMCALASRYFVELPPEGADVSEWDPTPIDVSSVQYGYNIVGGNMYDFDIERNLSLVKQHFPDTKTIAFMSDNSYGGMAMAALVRQTAKNHPEYRFTYLDGRKESLSSIRVRLRNLQKNTVLLLGTWRVDKLDSYFVKNSLYQLREDCPGIPVYTISQIGLGYWAIGGYVPQYFDQGTGLAQQTIAYLNGSNQQVKSQYYGLSMVPNEYRFDIEAVIENNIEPTMLPVNARYINEKLTFFEQYTREVMLITLAFIVLLTFLIFITMLYRRTKRLTQKLRSNEQQLKLARDRAEEGNRMKTAFLANMSHEIRTPLNAIVGFAELMSEGTELPIEERKRISNIISQNSAMLLNLINDILDMSRLEAGRSKFTLEECDIVALARETLVTVKTATKSKLQFLFDPQMPECILSIDRQRIRQVLMNLTTNAVKFTKEGSILLTISKDDKYVRISVADTGIGIPADKSEKIFERFEKLNETSQGTGLGLSMCKMIVEHFGGEIWVDTTYTDGAKFVFTIPK
ncbi:MAG: HAMP domain-containing histidine kinase [Bacteroidales bacterium]|nr:HAMP domain-containing histidine kinase [Bacteroidales bacterium]